MNSLVVLVACLAAASASGYAGVYSGAYGVPGAYYGGHGGYGAYGYPGGYAGPQALPVVLPSGYLADTPEVAAVKGAHHTALASAAARSGAYGPAAYGAYGPGYGAYGYGAYGYAGPQALPVVLPSGYLADTPSVSAVKAAHQTAVAVQGGATHPGYGYGYQGYGHGYYH